jgi:hypothetical protein
MIANDNPEGHRRGGGPYGERCADCRASSCPQNCFEPTHERNVLIALCRWLYNLKRLWRRLRGRCLDCGFSLMRWKEDGLAWLICTHCQRDLLRCHHCNKNRAFGEMYGMGQRRLGS